MAEDSHRLLEPVELEASEPDEEAPLEERDAFWTPRSRELRATRPRRAAPSMYAAGGALLGLAVVAVLRRQYGGPQVPTAPSFRAGVETLDAKDAASVFPDCQPKANGDDPCKPKGFDEMMITGAGAQGYGQEERVIMDGESQDPHQETGAACSWGGENCSATRCCRDAGFQCYQQDHLWAECRASCAMAPDPVHWNGKNWSCKELGPRADGEVPTCAAAGGDCTASRCCETPGLQCFEKTPGVFAGCKASCAPGVDFTDANSDPWTCRVLGPRAKPAADWVADECAAPGMGCKDAGCCMEPGAQCYLRDEYWSQCLHNCTAAGPDGMEWSCHAVGLRTPPAAVNRSEHEDKEVVLAPWVGETCAQAGDNCVDVGCCAHAGMRCYQKNHSFATCQAQCTPGPDLYAAEPGPWTCAPVGPRTPGVARAAPPAPMGLKVADWVATECAAKDESCESSMCCQDEGLQCYTKKEGWAACLTSCTPGENRTKHGDPDGAPWECKKLGERTPRSWASPSLFCFAVTRVEGYEPDLIKDQLRNKAGIFACDQYAVFSSTTYTGSATTYWHPKDEPKQPMVSIDLGMGPLGPVKTIAFEPTYVGKSMDGTAGNTELFLRVWNKVQEHGQYLTTDWTIKVDPDAVMIVPRMRAILKEFTGKSTYIINCNKPFMTPMMFGSVEVFSKQALVAFFDRQSTCLDGLGWKAWGEDYFMGKCLESLGVTGTDQFSMVSDGVCKGVDCADPHAAAFHPKKDSADWMACFHQAMAATSQ